MTHPAFFYLAGFIIGFLLCFPFGAASLEMLRLSLAGRRRPALFVAAGAGLACGGWALLSFIGVRSVLHLMEMPWVKVVMPAVAAVLLAWLAVLAWRDSRRIRGDAAPGGAKTNSPGPVAQLGKGVLLGLVNPQTIASWVLILSLLRQAGFTVPRTGSAWLPFFLAVTSGYGAFFIAVIQLAPRLRFLGLAGSRAGAQRAVSFLLAGMSGLCALASLRAALS